MINPVKLIKVFWDIMKLIKGIKEDGMGSLLKSTAGWLKIIAYIATIISLAMGFLDPKAALIITVSISAVVKFSEQIIGLTPSTADDEFLNKVKEILKKYGLLK
jgi:hypothetical protein